MKQVTREHLGYAKEKRRFPYWMSALFALVMIVLFALPYFYTVSNGTRSNILGFTSFVFLQDQADLVYYGVACFLVSLVCNIALFIVSLMSLFMDEKYLKKDFIVVLVIFILIAGFNIAGSATASFTATNIKLNWGAYLVPSISVVLLGVFLALFFNFRDKKEAFSKPLTDKKENN